MREIAIEVNVNGSISGYVLQQIYLTRIHIERF